MGVSALVMSASLAPPSASGLASEAATRCTRFELKPANSGRAVASRQVTRSLFSRTAFKPAKRQDNVAACEGGMSEVIGAAHPHANTTPVNRTIDFRIPFKIAETQ